MERKARALKSTLAGDRTTEQETAQGPSLDHTSKPEESISPDMVSDHGRRWLSAGLGWLRSTGQHRGASAEPVVLVRDAGKAWPRLFDKRGISSIQRHSIVVSQDILKSK